MVAVIDTLTKDTLTRSEESRCAQEAALPHASVELGDDITLAQAELERSAHIAGLKNDPTAPLVRALSASLGLQWRLHDQAVRYFRTASERLDRQLEDTIAQGELALETRRTAIVEELAPVLAALTTKNVRTWGRSVTAKTALTFGGFAVALALGVAAAGYGAGWKAGQVSAVTVSKTLAAALAQGGPETETALVRMIQANNVAEAWDRCQRSAVADKEGRRVCSMLMWADPQEQPTK